MGNRLQVSTKDLGDAGKGLRFVATEFECLGKLVDELDRRTVGHQYLQEKLQDFADEWNDNRKKMVDEIAGLGKLASKAAEVYEEVDTKFMNALLGKGEKGKGA